MKNAIKVLWYVVIAAMVLTVFVLVSAKVFAHGDGKCLTDADDDVRLSNDGWVKIIDHLSGDDLDGFAHGHLYEYYDKRGNSTGKAMGFFSIDFDDTDGDYFADCPPIRQSDGETHLVDYFLDRPTTPDTPTTTPTTTPDTPTTTPDTPTTTPTTTPTPTTSTRHSHNHSHNHMFLHHQQPLRRMFLHHQEPLRRMFLHHQEPLRRMFLHHQEPLQVIREPQKQVLLQHQVRRA